MNKSKKVYMNLIEYLLAMQIFVKTLENPSKEFLFPEHTFLLQNLPVFSL